MPGIEVQVALQAAPGTLAFDTDLGFEIRLEEAVLSITSLELLPCAPGAGPPTTAGVLDRLSPWGATAYAHIEEQPTVSNAVRPLDALHSGGLAVVVATLRPPPGRYCGLRVALARAGAPAGGAIAAARAGTKPAPSALRVRGRARRAGVEHAVSVDAAADRSVEAPLTEALALSADQLTGAVTLFVDQRRWLDGVDFARAGAAAQHARVIDNVLSGLTTR